MSRIDLNRAPYFDDFDPSKNYMRVLFRPGRPVQARELNVAQSTLQNQIERFASHVFKNGSKVSNGRAALRAVSYVRLIDLVGGSPAMVAQFAEGTKIVGAYSGITATLVRGVNAEAGDPPTLFVVYTGTAIDGQTDTFVPGETVNILDENDVVVYSVEVRCPTCVGSNLVGETIPPTGTGQMFTVDDGVYYYDGMFLDVTRQSIVVQKYLLKDEDGNITNGQACKIGFDFVQTLVTYADDSSLLDPSLGYPNSTAPGADRYKAELVLVKRSYDHADGDNFIVLCRLSAAGKVEFIKSDAEYAEIMDMIAKRTYETNGDYTVRPFKVQFYESKKTSANDPKGWTLDGSEDHLIAAVSPAIGYVRGYRVETVDTTAVPVRKARDTKTYSGFVKNFGQRTYLTIRPAGGRSWTGANSDMSLMSGITVNVFDGHVVSGAATGSAIGSFKVNDIYREYGNPEDNSAIYRYYIYDLTLVAGKKLNDALSFTTAEGFVGEAVVDPITSKVEVYNANNTGLVFQIDRENVKSLRSLTDPSNGSIDVYLRKKFTGTLNGSGALTFTTTSNEFFAGFDNSLTGWVVDGGTTTAVNLTPLNTLVGSTTLDVSLGAGHAGKTFHLIATVLHTAQKEKTKTITTHSFTTSTVPTWIAGETHALNRVDAFELIKVTAVNSVDSGWVNIDMTNEYELVSNITDTAYRESFLRRKADHLSLVGNANIRLLIEFRYFAHSGGQGYYTIDSYSEALNDPDSGISYENLPDFLSSTKKVYSVNNTFDFRPDILGANPVSALLPANGSTAVFDIEYYLGRADLLMINKDGLLYAKEGTPSETPTIPRVDENAMALYEIYLNPYTYGLDDVRTKFIENKRYTMRDIGRIEDRVAKVEYYTALSMLEQDAATMSIKDENGLDRFKNGFVADNFSDFQAADMTNIEWRAGVDRTYRELRPSFKSRNHKLSVAIGKSTGVQLKGKVAMLPYTETVADSNPFATKHLSINPLIQFDKRGQMYLSPNNDTWSDENRLPELTIDIDSGVDAMRDMADAAGLLGTDWGTWVDQSRTIVGTSTQTSTTTTGLPSNFTRGTIFANTNSGVTTTSTVTTNQVATTSTRTGTATTVESRTESYSVGDIVRDVQIIPYIRESAVQFHATGMKANTRVWAFFDGQPVSAHCRDIGFQLTSGNAAQMRSRIAYGSPLITDANGELLGEFRIPGSTFFTGEKTLRLTDDETGSSDADMTTTSAEANYFAGGLDVTKQEVTLNVASPTFSTREVSETITNITTETTRTSTSSGPCSNFPQSSVQFRSCWCSNYPTASVCRDPIAQAFTLDEDSTVSGLDLFFKQFDPTSTSIFVELRTMSGGFPTETVLGRKDLLVADLIAGVKYSEDSTVPLKVSFDTPIYVQGGTAYCFVIGGSSPDTRVWVARLGGEVVNQPGKIMETTPTGMPSFRSLNGSTWNAEQYETIKYNLYIAKFSTTPMNLVLENDPGERWFLESNPLEFQNGSNRMRIFAPNHGFVVNDRIKITCSNDVWMPILADNNLPPQPGQVIHTVSGSGVVSEVETVNEGSSSYRIKVKNMIGVFTENQQFTADPTTRTIRDTYLASKFGGKKATNITLNEAFGTFTADSYAPNFPSGGIAGVPLAELNKQHIVVAVDSQDSVVVELSVNATMSGRYGGDYVQAFDMCEKYDLFNISGAWTNVSGSSNWTMRGIGHGRTGDAFAGDDYQEMPTLSFVPGEDRYLGQPYKVASKDNEVRVLGTNKSVEVVATLATSNPNVSPMVNLDSFSITTVSNRVEAISPATFNISPNASGRLVPETHGFLGSEQYKYVTRPVLLANPANDLMIYFDVYKDKNADFDVYVKRITPYETDDIDSVGWMLVNGLQKNYQSVDLTDRIEYEIKCSELVSGWLDGSDFIPFTGFKVKIVGRTTNSAKPPTFRSLRAIAVT